MKKFDRPGEGFWIEWDGEDYDADATLVYVTFGDVDYESDIARKALAYSLQKDGIADSVSEAHGMIQYAVFVSGNTGILDGEKYRVPCDASGMTPFGDCVLQDTNIRTIWAEFQV